MPSALDSFLSFTGSSAREAVAEYFAPFRALYQSLCSESGFARGSARDAFPREAQYRQAMPDEPASAATTVTLEQAIETAFSFVEGLAERLRGKVYGLEETDWRDGSWRITLSLIRPPVQARGNVVPSVLLGEVEAANPVWSRKTVEVDGRSGRVLRMLDADR